MARMVMCFHTLCLRDLRVLRKRAWAIKFEVVYRGHQKIKTLKRTLAEMDERVKHFGANTWEARSSTLLCTDGVGQSDTTLPRLGLSLVAGCNTIESTVDAL